MALLVLGNEVLLGCPVRAEGNRAVRAKVAITAERGAPPMAQLIVRNLEEALVRQLEVRAAAHGRSAEEEHREILRRTLGPAAAPPLKQSLLAMPDHGADRDFDRADDRGRELDR